MKPCPISRCARPSSSAFPARPRRTSSTCSIGSGYAQIDRAGCFKYEAVAGAAANDLPDAVPEAVKEERWHRFMAAQSAISAARLAAKVGRTLPVIIDAVDDDGGASGRSKYDAPEIDGEIHLRDCRGVAVGDIVLAMIEDADDTDLFGVPA